MRCGIGKNRGSLIVLSKALCAFVHSFICPFCDYSPLLARGAEEITELRERTDGLFVVGVCVLAFGVAFACLVVRFAVGLLPVGFAAEGDFFVVTGSSVVGLS